MFPRAEAWLTGHRRRVLVAFAAAAAFVRLLLVLQVAAGPLARQHQLIRDSDNRFFHTWAQHLAAGDWLQEQPTFPMMGWMVRVAAHALDTDPDLPVRLGLAKDRTYDRAAMSHRLWQHWLGERVYYQEPAYAYLVALTYRLAGPEVWAVFAWQLLLGVAGVLLAAALARRLAGEVAAVAAAVLAVLSPVFPFLELNLLRDSLVVFTTLLVAWAMLWAPERGGWRWLVLGVLFGAALLVKQSFLFVPPLFAAGRLLGRRTGQEGWGPRARAAGLVVAGMALGFAPAALRNLLLGVPALAINGSAVAMISMFHVAEASPTALSVSPTYARILVAADGRYWTSMVEAIRTHADLWGFVWLNLQKLAGAFHGYELPNNVDLYVFRQGAPAARLLFVCFPLVAVLAAVGATLRTARALPLLIAAAAQIPTLILVMPISRYRAPMAAALLPLAGVGVVQLARWARGRRWAPLAAVAAGAALYLAWATSPLPGLDPASRAEAYRRAGQQARAVGEPSFAAMQLRAAQALVPGDQGVALELGLALLAAGEPDEALAPLQRAAEAPDAAAREAYAEALAAVGRRQEAADQARRALALEPGRARARALTADPPMPPPQGDP